MTIPENKPAGNDDHIFRWGTWEELLLAFAVNRHGAGAWASIASELQKRIPGQNRSLTAQNCRQKYIDLTHRYASQNNDGRGNDENLNDDEVAGTVPLLEELRKLRVAELRLEVQRYDINIELLESKMKGMEEYIDRGTRKEKNDSDLEIKNENNREGKDVGQDAKTLPDTETGHDVFTAEESEKDRMSVNESNSTDLVAEKLRTIEEGAEPMETEKSEAGRKRTAERSKEPEDLKSEPAEEDSCNGSSNSIEKESDQKTPAELGSDSRDLMESEAESKGGGDDATKGTSDVQSSASRSRKEGSDKTRRCSTSGDERDHGIQSCAVKESSAQSQPFIEFLQSLWAHKLGSVFTRRLRSQESSKYQKLILQHVDLETIEARLKEGWYSGSASKFFRDLLLLVNNALVFFSKNSSEVQAASEIRQLISNEMSQKFVKSEFSSRKQISLQSLSVPNKEEQDPSHSMLLKPGITGSLIICRKRSSIAAKASLSSSGADNKKKEQVAVLAAAKASLSSSGADNKKKEQVAVLAEEKDSKLQPSQHSGNAEEPKITKKRTRDRFPSASVNSKKNGKNQGNNNTGNKNPVADSGKQQGKGGSSSQPSELKVEKKKGQPNGDSKKRGAANFLSRMKQKSSSNNGLLLDALKNTPLTSESTNSKGESEQKKNDNAKRGEKKDQVTRRSSEAKKAKEKGSPPKRNVGRPPKRGTPPPPLGKRSREGSETEIAVSKKPKKRLRK